ncbi:uncharacterized protein [Musca autumnalis]|uniref:uncharacterized protein n=1 Tax=Musca autumnalis TaxID=221902 RepID=UPI003CF3EDB7
MQTRIKTLLLFALLSLPCILVFPTGTTPTTTDELVDYVLANKFYYFDAKATALETELEEMLKEIYSAKEEYANDSNKLKVYEAAQHFGEKYLEMFRRHKFQCGVKNVFHFMSPTVTRIILATENADVAIHWHNHFKMFTDEMDNYETRVEEIHDVIEEFTKGNRNLKKEYHDKYTAKANSKCDLKVFMNEIH